MAEDPLFYWVGWKHRDDALAYAAANVPAPAVDVAVDPKGKAELHHVEWVAKG